MKSITLLKLKIIEGHERLEHIAKLCRLGRNAAVENWLLRQRGLPESKKQAAKPKPRKRNGVSVATEPKPLSEATKLYHAVTACVPTLDTQAASMISRHISSQLGKKLDWRRRGEGGVFRMRDSVLAYEDRPPFSTSLEIPVRSVNVSLGVSPQKTTVTVRLERGCDDEFVVDTSGKYFPKRWRTLLREIGGGQRKLEDSRIVQKRNRYDKLEWFWFVTVTEEREQIGTETVELHPVMPQEGDEHKKDRPFCCILPGGNAWYVGDGRYLIGQLQRFIRIRKEIGWPYRYGNGRGHGRKKVDAAMHKRRLQQKSVVDEFRYRLINDIIHQCRRSSAGTVVYYEPSPPAKEQCWFHCRGVEWCWTTFESKLKNACARNNIEVQVEKHGTRRKRKDD